VANGLWAEFGLGNRINTPKPILKGFLLHQNFVIGCPWVERGLGREGMRGGGRLMPSPIPYHGFVELKSSDA